MKVKKSKWLAILTIVAMLVTLFPAMSIAEEHDPIPNYGFIPNSGEASVSKVDLVNMTEVARYYTAPRADPNPYDWRTSRIAMDSDGNAWVLNTGADGTNLQGSVVRIQADTEGLANTNTDPDNPLDFGTDDAVQVFPVGAAGEMPRAIAIDADGFIWVGFYSGGYLMKYAYDPDAVDPADVWTVEAGPFRLGEGTANNIKFYEMKFAPDGTLFISSRSSTPTRSGVEGVYSFDGSEFTLEWAVNPYSLLIDPVSGQVYATSYSNVLWVRGVGTKPITGATNLRGMAFDGLGKIWIANTAGATGGNRVYSYDIATDGIDFITLQVGNTPVGVGRDEAGLMWAICRTDNQAQGYIEAFDPSDKTAAGSIQVGYRPYAYGDFVVPPPPTGSICGTKYENFYTGVANFETLSGWTILLYKGAPAVGDLDINDAYMSAVTDENGDYCFDDLPYDTYYVYELIGSEEECYAQWTGTVGGGSNARTFPEFYSVTLNDDNVDATMIDFVNVRGAIQGKKAYWDGEGTFSPTLGLDGWTIWLFDEELDLDVDELDEATEGYVAHTVTSGGGSYQFTGLCSGTYYVYEEQQDGYVQTWPVSGFYTVVLSAGQRVTGRHFGNMEEEYNICGYKYLFGTETTIAGWKIYLHEEELDEGDDPAVGFLRETVTDADGKYCFDELPAGTYFVYEELRDGYKAHVLFHEVTVPGGETDLEADEPIFYNFYNEQETCQTAWGYNEDANENWDLIGVTNWGWNFGPLTEGDTVEFELWAAAGQNILANGELVGTGTISYIGGEVTVELEMFEEFRLSDFHLWVGATELPEIVQKKGNVVYTSAPGQFIKYMDADDVDGDFDEEGAAYTVSNVDGEIYVAIHIVACWFPSDIAD